MSACSEPEEWCGSGPANELRERQADKLHYSTIHEVLDIGRDSPIAIFAHRGGWHCEEMDAAPENSLPNLEKAIRMGFDGYETDLWVSADGVFLIHHDETLDRTTSGSGDIESTTFEESRQLRLKYPSGNLSDEQVPTFEELITAGRGRILFLVEVKGRARNLLPELLETLRELDMTDQVFFWVDWSVEYAELYEQLLESGLTEVRTNVLWRTRTLEALEDVVRRFDPLMVDIPPTQEELNSVHGYRTWLFGILPEQHLSIVEAAHGHGVKVMVSKVITNSYLDGLQKRGVRVFMSRNPEVQLLYVIDEELHH